MMKTDGTKIRTASTGCSPTTPLGKAERVGVRPSVVETSDRCEVPTSWLTQMTAEVSELREMLREAVADAAVRAQTASGRRKAMAFLGRMYRHSLTNHQTADRASELGDVEVTIIVSELQKVIDDVVIQLEEILATPPTSVRAHHERARQPEAGR